MEKVKTIITRAVYGAAEKECRQTLSLDTYDDTAEHGPQNILGCVVQDMRLSNPVLESKGKGEITVGVRGPNGMYGTRWGTTPVFGASGFFQHITVEGQDGCPIPMRETAPGSSTNGA